MAKNYYDILEVPRTADDATICEAYRRLATKWYPKNNRDKLMEAEHMFHEVAEAFEVLSDRNVHTAIKRTAFDQFGEFGLKNGIADGRGGFHGGYEYLKNADKIYEDFCKRTNPFFHAHEILGTTEESSIFGAALRGLDGPKKTPPEDLVVEVPCSLPELYNGATKAITFKRVRVNIDKVTTRLEECKKEVFVKRGYANDVELRFEGEGNESPVFPSSSLIVRIKESPHSTFFRKGADLVYTHSMTLLEALMAEPFSIV